MATQKLNELALGYSVAIISAVSMLLLGVLGPLGIYSGMASMMQDGHMFFALSPLGVIFGIIEAGILGFLGGFLTAKLYNIFADK